jgi:phage tail sheath protein FI
MIAHKTPGVYVEEISTLPRSVVPVSTAIPAFIGYTEKAELQDGTSLKNIPTRISSLLEYELFFGGPPKQSFTVEVGPNKQRVSDETDIDIQVEVKKAEILLNEHSPFRMFYALRMFFANGGGPCHILSVEAGYEDNTGNPKTVNKALLGSTGGLKIIEKLDEVTLLLFPDIDGLDETDYYGLYGEALDQCNKLKDRFTLIDVKQDVSANTGNNIVDASGVMRSELTGDFLNYGAAYYPWLNTSLAYIYEESDITLKQDIGTLDENGDPIADDPKELNEKTLDAADSIVKNSRFLADLDNLIQSLPVLMPPTSAIAGIYTRVDADRGVFKAPANVAVNNIVGLTETISDDEQQDLNVHPSGKSINAIRFFTNKGILVWGARTLDGNSNEFRYVPVRRFFILAEESIKKATEAYVFEPNDDNTWGRIKALIENFLILQWRAGALQGATPEQAFFVNVGLGETMTSLDILEGRLIIEVGLAAVRPAEFIILRFSHKLAES